MVYCPNLCNYATHKVRQEGRDRFSGAVEAFSRRNATGSGLPGEHSRHRDHSRNRSSDDVPSSKDVVKRKYALLPLFLHESDGSINADLIRRSRCWSLWSPLNQRSKGYMWSTKVTQGTVGNFKRSISYNPF